MGLDMYLYKSAYIEEEVAYWRKANQIHGWFVRNIQNDVDDCKPYEVPIEALKELLEVCKQVIADNSRIEELLPVTGGFFFGSYYYDEWYFNDIKDTIQMLTECLEDGGDESSTFIYQSSW